VDHLSDAPLFSLNSRYLTRLEALARDKLSSLSDPFVGDGEEKRFIRLTPGQRSSAGRAAVKLKLGRCCKSASCR